MNPRDIQWKYVFGDVLQSDRGERGTVIGCSAAIAKGGHGFAKSYRLEVIDPIWQDKNFVWVPEPGLRPVDG